MKIKRTREKILSKSDYASRHISNSLLNITKKKKKKKGESLRYPFEFVK